MSPERSISQHFNDLYGIINQQPKDDDRLWHNMSSSLRMVAQKFSTWGALLGKVKQPPEFRTVEEIVEAIDDFKTLSRLTNKWLNRFPPGSRWQSLKSGLDDAETAWKRSKAAAKLSAYYQWRTEKGKMKKPTEPPGKIVYRENAGEHLILYAERIEEAIEGAQ